MATYLQIPGIQGNVTLPSYQGWIQLQNLHHEFHRPINAMVPGRVNSREVGIPRFTEFEITKLVDQTSPELLQQAAEPNAIPKVKISLVRTDSQGAQPMLEYTLYNVLITQIITAREGNAKPYEILSLNATKYEMRYTPSNADHSSGSPVSCGYDLEKAQTV